MKVPSINPKLVPPLIYAALIVMFAIGVRSLFPKVVERTVIQHLPVIVTKYDTVLTVNKATQDSLDRFKHTKRDTTYIPGETLTLTNTVYDTVWLADTNNYKYWPILSIEVGKHFGDTTTIQTLSLRSGNLSISRVLTPGLLRNVRAADKPIPQLDFEQYPICPAYKVHFGDKLKYSAYGSIAGALVTLLLVKF